jgi:septal ring factor EnvC (AmiA/AmiB activator)
MGPNRGRMDGEPESTPVISEEWQRPIEAQIANIRHRLGSVEQQITALDRTDEKTVRRIEGVEDRLTLLEAQLVALPGMIDDVMEKRAVRVRAERIQDVKEAFGRTRSTALFIIAMGQALFMVVAIYALIHGNPFH